MLAAEHGNADMSVTQIQQRFSQAVHFVPEQNADRKAWLPIVQIRGVNAGFDCRDFVALLPQPQEQSRGIGVMLPSDGFFSA